jgi:ATP sulfurylase
MTYCFLLIEFRFGHREPLATLEATSIMLGIGGFTPLDGFMTGSRRLAGRRLRRHEDRLGLFWPIPITLSADHSPPRPSRPAMKLP